MTRSCADSLSTNFLHMETNNNYCLADGTFNFNNALNCFQICIKQPLVLQHGQATCTSYIFPPPVRGRSKGNLSNFMFFIYFNLLYSSSNTASHHSFDVSSPGTSTARCANQLSGAAPCQCFTSAGMTTTSPG